MVRSRKNNIMIITTVLLVLFMGTLSYCTRFLSGYWSAIINSSVPIFYAAMAFFWLSSLRKRVMSVKVVRLLSLICALVIFWMVLRKMRYQLLDFGLLHTYCWYLYYVPQIFVPLIGFYVVYSLILSDMEMPSPRQLWFLVPAILLFLLVLTNDYHQWCFVFDPAVEDPANHHTWSWGYFLVMAWIIGWIAATIFYLYRQSDILKIRRKVWIPITIFLFCAFLCLAQELGWQQFYKMPEMFCITYAFTLEACIQIGMVPVNTNYEKLFAISRIPVLIYDYDGGVVYASRTSDNFEELTYPEWVKKEAGVAGGFVDWAEDQRETLRFQSRLTEIRKQLSEDNTLLQSENELISRREHIKEQNRLYDELTSFTGEHLVELEELIGKAERKDIESFERYEAIAKACVKTAYVKRRSNLMLLMKESSELSYGELFNCLKETSSYLTLYGAASSVSVSSFIRDEDRMRGETALSLYDSLQKVLEYVLDHAEYISLFLGKEEGPCLRIMLEVMGEKEEKEAWLAEHLEELQHRKTEGVRLSAETEEGTIYIALLGEDAL